MSNAKFEVLSRGQIISNGLLLKQSFNISDAPNHPPVYESFEMVADSGTEKPTGRVTFVDIQFAADHPIRVANAGGHIDDRPRWFHPHSQQIGFKKRQFGVLFAFGTTELATTGRLAAAFSNHFPNCDYEAYSVQDEAYNQSTVLIVPLVEPLGEREWLAAQSTLDDLITPLVVTNRDAALDPDTKIPMASFATSYEQARYNRMGFYLKVGQAEAALP